MDERGALRAKLLENAAEINRLHRRIHETVKRRGESEELREEWSQACQEFHTRYAELCLPGGPYPDFYERLSVGDPSVIEIALCFLEVRPYFFRSGYHWKTILKKCKRAPISGEQSERFAKVLERYTEWKKLQNLSSKRGGAVRRDIITILLRFYNLFPVKLSDAKFDGVVTVSDLYAVLCKALRIEPQSPSDKHMGVVREPCQAVVQADMSTWARQYGAWRESAWTPEDVWATLVWNIVDAYRLGPTVVIAPETILLELPKGRLSK